MGLPRILDLHFLLEPQFFAWARIALAIALILYVFRIWQALPIALSLTSRLVESSIHRGRFSTPCKSSRLFCSRKRLLYVYGAWADRNNKTPQLTENRAIWWSQQTIVAVYLLAGIAKLIATGGLWIFQARWIGVSIAKAAYQSFYDSFNSAELERQLSIAHFAAAHGWLVALIATAGLLLELGSPLMLMNRVWAVLLGGAMVCFHLGLDYTMGLSFIYNQWLLIIFMINLPYWIMRAGQKLFGRAQAETTSP